MIYTQSTSRITTKFLVYKYTKLNCSYIGANAWYIQAKVLIHRLLNIFKLVSSIQTTLCICFNVCSRPHHQIVRLWFAIYSFIAACLSWSSTSREGSQRTYDRENTQSNFAPQQQDLFVSLLFSPQATFLFIKSGFLLLTCNRTLKASHKECHCSWSSVSVSPTPLPYLMRNRVCIPGLCY